MGMRAFFFLSVALVVFLYLHVQQSTHGNTDILEGSIAVWKALFHSASWKTLFWLDMHNYDRSASDKQISRVHSVRSTLQIP